MEKQRYETPVCTTVLFHTGITMLIPSREGALEADFLFPDELAAP